MLFLDQLFLNYNSACSSIHSYYVRLPDTRLMRVDYYVDAYGFHPTVTFEGEAQYPTAPSQGYGKPAPPPSEFYAQPGK